MEDLTLIRALIAAAAEGQQAVLCTVIDSSGSVPRGAGARMAVFSGGRALGTVGGGSVERLAQRRAVELLAGSPGGTEHYSLGGESSDTGMVCGGEAVICFQRLDRETLPALNRWAELLQAGSPGWLLLDLTGSEPVLSVCPGQELPPEWSARREARGQLLDGLYTEPVCREGTLYLFGAGHVGQALARALVPLEFRVVVMDSRADLARAERFPAACQVICGDFSRLSDWVDIGPKDYVVIMTPGHRDDLEVLCQALACRPGYLGCLGSRRKREFVCQTLRQKGFSEAEIAGVHLPIGLPIGGETPEEIAVSIAAELIRHRAAARPGGRHSCPA